MSLLMDAFVAWCDRLARATVLPDDATRALVADVLGGAR